MTANAETVPGAGAVPVRPDRSMLSEPGDPEGFPAVIAVLRDHRRIVAWARRYCCATDSPDPVTLRRIVEAAADLPVQALARWANSSSADRRFPWGLIGAVLHVKRQDLIGKIARVPLRFEQMGDHFARLLCAIAPDSVAGSALSARTIAYMQQVTASVVLDAGFVPEYNALCTRMSRFNAASRASWPGGDARYLDGNWITAIGHIAILAHVLVGQRCGLLDGHWTGVVKGPVANSYLFNLIARANGNAKLVAGGDVFYETHSSGNTELVNGVPLDWFELCGMVAATVDPERGAVAAVPEAARRELADFLDSVGHTPGRGYVTVHCREDGYRRNRRHQPRNASIADTLPALIRLVAAGYTVVRLGDPTMTRLPPHPGIVDYAHSPAKTGKLDVLLAAGAAFHIGSSSGMSLVPLLFGTPCLFLNWYPTTMLPWGPRTWTVLKTLRDAATGSRVSDPDLLHSVGKVPHAGVLREIGYAVEDLTADEITAAVAAYRVFLGERRAIGEPAAPATGASAVTPASITAPVFRAGPGQSLVPVPPRPRRCRDAERR